MQVRLVKNFNLTNEQLIHFTSDSKEIIRCGLAEREDCPINVLEILKNDGSERVRKSALDKLDTLEQTQNTSKSPTR